MHSDCFYCRENTRVLAYLYILRERISFLPPFNEILAGPDVSLTYKATIVLYTISLAFFQLG